MATDTSVSNLVINKMTKAQYDSLVNPSTTELYLVPDEMDTTPTAGSDNPVTSEGIKTYVDGAITGVTTDLSNKVDKVQSSTDNAVVRFNGTSSAIQNSSVTINDSGQVTAAKFVTSGGTASQYVKGNGDLASISTSDQYEAYLLWGGKNFQNNYGPLDASMVPELGSNRTQFINPNYVSVEYSRDGGETWLDYEATDAQKGNLFSVLALSGLRLGKATTKGEMTSSYMLRVTITDTSAAYIYTELRKFVIYDTTEGASGCYCTIQGRTAANFSSGTDTWTTFVNKVSLGGWSGYNVINYPSGFTTYGNQTSQYRQVRFIFGCTAGPSSSYYGFQLGKIMCFGGQGYSNPSYMAKQGHIYNWDYQQNVGFPAKVTAPTVRASSTLTVGTNGNVTEGMVFDGIELVDLMGTTKYPINNHYIDYKGDWISSTTYGHYAIPIEGVRAVRIKAPAPSTSASFFAFVKNYAFANPPTSDYAEGYWSRNMIPGDTEIEVLVPSDAEYLIIYPGSKSTQPYKPESLKLYGDFSTVIHDGSSYYGHIGALTAEEAVVSDWRNHDVTNLVASSLIRNGYIQSSTNKYISGTYYSSFIPLSTNVSKIKLTAGNAATRIAFLHIDVSANAVVSYAGETSTVLVNAGETVTLDVPSGTLLLYVFLGTLSSDVYSAMPSGLYFTGNRGVENFPLTINSTTYDGSAPASITGLAIDSDVVHTTGDENISGIKKFQSDIWLYSDGGDTPGLIFQRGSNTSYIDWKVFNSAGILRFSANRNSNPLVYTDLFKLNGDTSYPEATLSLKLIAQSDVSVSGDIIGKLGKNATLANASILDATNHSLLGNNASTLKAVDDRPPTVKNIVDYVDDCISHITPGTSSMFNNTTDGIVTHIGTTGGTAVNNTTEHDTTTNFNGNPQYLLSSRGYWVNPVKYGVCTTEPSSSKKTVNVSGYVSLVDGERVTVKFTYTNTAKAPITINVNSTGNINLYRFGTTFPGNASGSVSWQAGAVLDIIYSAADNCWKIVGGNINTSVELNVTDSSTTKYPLVFPKTTGANIPGVDYLRYARNYSASDTQLCVTPRGDMFVRSLSLGSKTSTSISSGDISTSGSIAADSNISSGGNVAATGNVVAGGNAEISGALHFLTTDASKHPVNAALANYYDDGSDGVAVLELDDPAGSGDVIIRSVADPVLYNDAANKKFVQDSVESVEDELYPTLCDEEEIVSDIGTKYPYKNGYISTLTAEYNSSSSYRYVVVPAAGIRRIEVSANSSYPTSFGFLATYTEGATPTYTFPTGYSNVVLVLPGRTATLDVPQGTNWIYINASSDNTPQSVKITGTGITDPADEYKNHYTKLYDESIKRNLYLYDISSETAEWVQRRGYIINSNSNWASSSTSSTYIHFLVPIEPGTISKIVAKWAYKASTATQLAWLTDLDANNAGNAAHLCTGTTPYIPAATNTEYELEVPSTARWLYLYLGNGSTNYLPSTIKIIGSIADNEVHKTGDETITGEKTFTSDVSLALDTNLRLLTDDDEGVCIIQGESGSGENRELNFYGISDDGLVRLKHLAEPETNTDAATKYYVDQAVAGGGGGGGAGGTIYFGSVESTSTSTAFTATISGITALSNGLCVYLTNDVVTSAAGYTIDINGLGPKPVYMSNEASTASTTQFAAGSTYMFIYNGNRVSGGLHVHLQRKPCFWRMLGLVL